MKIAVNVGILLFFLSCSQIGSDSKDPESGLNYIYQNKAGFEKIHLNIQEKELDNGLKIVVVPKKDLPILSFYTLVKVGSKDEPEKKTGMAHFLEHLMFKGTKNNPDGMFDQKVESFGGSSNAFTSQDSTVYYIWGPSDKLEEIMSLESDRINGLSFTKEAFENEKNVVIEEHKMRLENSPYGKLYYHLFSEIFKKTSYQHSVLGKKEDIISLKHQDVLEFYHSFYQSDNIRLFIVGDVEPERVFKLAQRYYSHLPSTKDKEKEKEQKEKLVKVPNRSIDLYGNSRTPLFALGFSGVPRGDNDSYLLELMAIMLTEGKSSYLQSEFVENERPLFSQLFAQNVSLEKSGAFFLMGKLYTKVGIKWSEKRLRRKLKNSCKEMINERSLQKAKNHYLINLMKQLSQNSELTEYVIDNYLINENPGIYKNEIQTIVNADKNQVIQVCQKYLNSREGLYLSLWNKNPKWRVR